jgi:hypothetical protein
MSTSTSDSDSYILATQIFSALGATGNVILFCAQMPLIYKMHTVDKDASLYDPLPSMTMLFTMSLWSGYSVWVLPTIQLYVANFSGIFLPGVYLCFFAYYSKTLKAKLYIILTTIAIEAAAWLLCWGIYVASGRSDALMIGGAVTCAVNCTFFISPLRRIVEAFKERDLSRTPVILSIVSFFQGMTWIIAAVLLRDDFILGINAAGFCFACIQLIVIAYIKFWVGEKIVPVLLPSEITTTIKNETVLIDKTKKELDTVEKETALEDSHIVSIPPVQENK